MAKARYLCGKVTGFGEKNPKSIRAKITKIYKIYHFSGCHCSETIKDRKVISKPGDGQSSKEEFTPTGQVFQPWQRPDMCVER